VTLSVKVSTEVSKLSLLVPTLAAVMLKAPAVMSVSTSPSSTAPAALKLTACVPAAMLPKVKLPAVTFTVTAPVAFTCVKVAAPALLLAEADEDG
jgi:hypothetical protein